MLCDLWYLWEDNGIELGCVRALKRLTRENAQTHLDTLELSSHELWHLLHKGEETKNSHSTHPEEPDVSATILVCRANSPALKPGLVNLKVIGKMKSHFTLLLGTETALQLVKR